MADLKHNGISGNGLIKTGKIGAALMLSLLLTACVAPSPKAPAPEAQALVVKEVVADMKSSINAFDAASAIQIGQAGLPKASPQRMVALSSARIEDFSPLKAHVLDAAPSWFQDGTLRSIEECAHCKAQGSIISSEYGKRRDPKRRSVYRQHQGIDVRAPKGSPIIAFKGGEVIRANRFSSYGLTVEVRQYDGVVARYAHMNKILVKQGDRIGTGDQVGEVGRTGRTTGAHLHFELLKDGDSLDPMNYMERAEQVIRCLKLEEASR